MSHRVFQIRKGADTKAEMMQVLPTSGNLDIVIHKRICFWPRERRAQKSKREVCKPRGKKLEKHCKDSRQTQSLHFLCLCTYHSEKQLSSPQGPQNMWYITRSLSHPVYLKESPDPLHQKHPFSWDVCDQTVIVTDWHRLPSFLLRSVLQDCGKKKTRFFCK